MVGDAPAIGSIMLTRDAMWELARHALLVVDGYDVVIHFPGSGFRAFNNDDHGVEHYLEMAAAMPESRTYRNWAKTSLAPGFGSRNTHAMSGRTV